MTKFDELVAKMTEIFQIGKPELDFGIYKVINTKAAMIRDYLQKNLKACVQKTLKEKSDATRTALEEKIAKLEEQLRNLQVPFETAPDWVSAQKNLASLEADDDAESLVYAHLLTFFSRYYDNGDFMSKRRYKEGVYAIPYAGEEVKLHWANADQYYTKTSENFTNYEFRLSNGKKVHFKLVQAATAKDNVKDSDCVRCFVLWNPAESESADGDGHLPPKILEVKDGELYVYFQYKKIQRPKKEDKRKGTKIPRQTEYVDVAEAVVSEVMSKEHLLEEFPVFAAAPSEKDKKRTLFRRELNRYVSKNTSDYFIHKDLRAFLTRELNNYVMKEMMNLDDISNATTFDMIARNLRLVQAFRRIGIELIGFMAQVEDFQKKLWLKKKFVMSSDYCFTLDRVPEDLRKEALANEQQQNEWKRLGFEDVGCSAPSAIDARMVDTQFFDESFKARLLRAIPDLDAQCDGVLVHSENFQALNLLAKRYEGHIGNIYIDPPYNSKTSEILYKNTYKHSSWLSLMYDRLRLISRYGTCPVTVAIDENEQEVLGLMLSEIFPTYDKTCISVIHNKKGIQGNFFSFCHESAYFCIPPTWQDFHGKQIPQDKWEYNNLRKWGSESHRSTARNCFYPIFVKDKTIVGFGDLCRDDEHPARSNVRLQDGRVAVYPIDESGIERKWRYARDTVEMILRLLKVVVTKGGEIQIHKAVDEENVKTVWSDNRYIAGDYGTKWLTDMGIKVSDNLYPKSLETVRDSIYAITHDDMVTMDFFAGSGTTGHAVIALNRDGLESEKHLLGRRKYVLVEMGDHFETVLKPRLEKAVYSPSWSNGKPTASEKGISHCFKYMTLESYEDTLNNLKLGMPGDLSALLKDEYMLNYMLEIESRPSLLSTDKLRHPFDYTLDIAVDASGATKPHKVDLVETFNYLVGILVKTIDRHVEEGFVLVWGVLPDGTDTVVVWRDCDKVDNAMLCGIIKSHAIKPHERGLILYVNGDHDLPNVIMDTDGGEAGWQVRSLDAEFLARMFKEG